MTDNLFKLREKIYRVEKGDLVPVSTAGHANTVREAAPRSGIMLVGQYSVIHISDAEMEATRRYGEKRPTPERPPVVVDELDQDELPPDRIYRCACGQAYSRQRWWRWEQKMSRARHQGELGEFQGDLWERRPEAQCVPLDWPPGWSDGGVCTRCRQIIMVESMVEAE